MKKEKKITIRLFLNDRVKNQNDENENSLHSLYYQIIYDRKNTHLSFSKLFNRDRDSYFFKNIDEVFRQKETRETVENDILLIKRVVRYLGPIFEENTIAGLKDYIPWYIENIFILLNRNLKRIIRDHLEQGSQRKWVQLIQWENEEITFVFVLNLFQHFFDLETEFGREKYNKLLAIKNLFTSLQSKTNRSKDESDQMENPTALLQLTNGYRLIDWLDGTLMQEIKDLSKSSDLNINPAELESAINWGLGRKNGRNLRLDANQAISFN